MSEAWQLSIPGWGSLYLLFPLVFAVWAAWGDLKTQNIPNYLTLSIALAGLCFHAAFCGSSGALHSLAGLGLGLAFLIIPYFMGSIEAGEVKTLGALGAWLGPWLTIILFCYMAVAGAFLALGALWWRGLLTARLKQWWASFLTYIFRRPKEKRRSFHFSLQSPGIHYGLAIALGMAVLYLRFYLQGTTI